MMKYILFVKDGCPFCIKAIELLERNKLKYHKINFEPDQEKILTELKESYDWPTVPMIFCRDEEKNELVGGYTDLVKRIKHE